MDPAMKEQRQRPEGRVVGRYILFDELAAGGMAAVYLGRMVGAAGFSRTVAIKRLHPHFAKDPDFRAMILDEARIVSRIQHTNVVPTIDVVAEGDDLLLVMDYVHGEPIVRLMRAARSLERPLPVRVCITLMAQALYGLHAAHEATDDRGLALHVVHRDVSPQNIIVGIDGVTRVLDFGVAKAVGQVQSTRTGQLKGKLAYMSPEQVRSLPLDRRTDIYAAAVVLWELLVGRPLFQGENDAATMLMILDGEIPSPSSLVEGISHELDAVVMRGLAADREDRFATAKKMAEALQRLGFATPSEISELVERLGAQALKDRGRAVAEIESRTLAGLAAPPTRPVESTDGALALPAQQIQSNTGTNGGMASARLPFMILALSATLVVAAAITVGFFLGRDHSPQAALPVFPSVSVSPPLPTTTPTATAASGSVAEPSPPVPSAVFSAKKPVRPRPSLCNPPYTVDKDGIRTPKPECL